ncbi:MAG: hypothetical protein ACK48B_11925, partial [Dolichospermum sp.]
GVKSCRYDKGTGNREQGTEKRFWVTLLFVTYVGFFPFTYLFTIPILCEAAQKNNHPYLSAVNYS